MGSPITAIEYSPEYSKRPDAARYRQIEVVTRDWRSSSCRGTGFSFSSGNAKYHIKEEKSHGSHQNA